MRSIFLEGLKTARDIIIDDGLASLNKLIAEHESGGFEQVTTTTVIHTARIKMKAEKR